MRPYRTWNRRIERRAWPGINPHRSSVQIVQFKTLYAAKQKMPHRHNTRGRIGDRP